MKSILITGAGGNLGRSITNELAKDHYLHATLSVSEDPGFFTEHSYKSNIGVEFINLTDEAASEDYVHKLIQSNDSIEAGILLVGGWQKGNIENTLLTDIDKMIMLNFATAYNIVRPLLSYFKRVGKGRFIFIGARPAIHVIDAKDQFAYAISKSMIINLAEIINQTSAGHNIQAHVIIPSVLDTPQNRVAMPDSNPTDWVNPEHIAQSIRFLLSAAGNNLRDTVLKMYNNA